MKIPLVHNEPTVVIKVLRNSERHWPQTTVLLEAKYEHTNCITLLVLNQAPRHEDVLGEWRYSSTYSLTSALIVDEWSTSRSGRFTPRERAPVTHWIGGWVGPRANLDVVVKRKFPDCINVPAL
jgi:hypothetical protein